MIERPVDLARSGGEIALGAMVREDRVGEGSGGRGGVGGVEDEGGRVDGDIPGRGVVDDVVVGLSGDGEVEVGGCGAWSAEGLLCAWERRHAVLVGGGGVEDVHGWREDRDGFAYVEGVKDSTVVDGDCVVGSRSDAYCRVEGHVDGSFGCSRNEDCEHVGMAGKPTCRLRLPISIHDYLSHASPFWDADV